MYHIMYSNHTHICTTIYNEWSGATIRGSYSCTIATSTTLAVLLVVIAGFRKQFCIRKDHINYLTIDYTRKDQIIYLTSIII